MWTPVQVRPRQALGPRTRVQRLEPCCQLSIRHRAARWCSIPNTSPHRRSSSDTHGRCQAIERPHLGPTPARFAAQLNRHCPLGRSRRPNTRGTPRSCGVRTSVETLQWRLRHLSPRALWSGSRKRRLTRYRFDRRCLTPSTRPQPCWSRRRRECRKLTQRQRASQFLARQEAHSRQQNLDRRVARPHRHPSTRHARRQQFHS